MFVCQRDCYVNKRFHPKGQSLNHRPCRHFESQEPQAGGGERQAALSQEEVAGLSYQELLSLGKRLAKARKESLPSRKRADLELFCLKGA